MYSFELKDKEWRGSRSIKLIVEVLDSITGKHVDPSTCSVQVKESGNRGHILSDRNKDVCTFRTKNGDFVAEDCYFVLDRDYEGDYHVESESLYHFPFSEKICKLKRNVKRTNGVPVLQIHLIPIRSYFLNLSRIRKDPNLRIKYEE